MKKQIDESQVTTTPGILPDIFIIFNTMSDKLYYLEAKLDSVTNDIDDTQERLKQLEMKRCAIQVAVDAISDFFKVNGKNPDDFAPKFRKARVGDV